MAQIRKQIHTRAPRGHVTVGQGECQNTFFASDLFTLYWMVITSQPSKLEDAHRVALAKMIDEG